MADDTIKQTHSPGSDKSIVQEIEAAPDAIGHLEHAQPGLKAVVANQDVDVAMALFDHPDQIHEVRDPAKEKALVRKIDFMILPYLAVCYAFFYIDKTTLSYAGKLSPPPPLQPMKFQPCLDQCRPAIFGIRQDLNLQGTDYSWLSSMFYFGFLFWAFPTNVMMQKFPIGRTQPSKSVRLGLTTPQGNTWVSTSSCGVCSHVNVYPEAAANSAPKEFS